MDNSVTSTPISPMTPGMNKDKNSTLTLVLIGIVIILCLGFIVVVIGYIGLTTGTNKQANTVSNNTTTNTTVNNTNNGIVAMEPEITITAPVVNTIINGKVNVSGTTTYQFKNIRVELFDDKNTKLASSTVSLTSVSDSVNNWQTELDVIESPDTTNGSIKITSNDPLAEESVSIKFETYSDTPENLIIYTPLKDQVMFSNDIQIRGEAKGLFEGNLQIRLKDQSSNVIYSDSVTIPDQYEAFRSFEYSITVEDLAKAEGKTGTWEFFYQSAKDGSEVVLQTIPVRFL